MIDLDNELSIINQMKGISNDLEDDFNEIKKIHKDLLVNNKGEIVELLSEKLLQCEENLTVYFHELENKLSGLSYTARIIYAEEQRLYYSSLKEPVRISDED